MVVDKNIDINGKISIDEANKHWLLTNMPIVESKNISQWIDGSYAVLNVSNAQKLKSILQSYLGFNSPKIQLDGGYLDMRNKPFIFNNTEDTNMTLPLTILQKGYCFRIY